MSRFYGWLTGNRGTTTRCGTRNSGVHTELRSTTGIEVSTELGEDRDGKDVIRFRITQNEKVLFVSKWDKLRGLTVSFPEPIRNGPVIHNYGHPPNRAAKKGKR